MEGDLKASSSGAYTPMEDGACGADAKVISPLSQLCWLRVGLLLRSIAIEKQGGWREGGFGGATEGGMIHAACGVP